jgi:hypothetical protein
MRAVEGVDQLRGDAHATALVSAEPREARGRTQFPELGLLFLGDAQGFVIQFLGGLGMPLSTIDVSSTTRR